MIVLWLPYVSYFALLEVILFNTSKRKQRIVLIYITELEMVHLFHTLQVQQSFYLSFLRSEFSQPMDSEHAMKYRELYLD